jgi:hypothetical protein
MACIVPSAAASSDRCQTTRHFPHAQEVVNRASVGAPARMPSGFLCARRREIPSDTPLQSSLFGFPSGSGEVRTTDQPEMNRFSFFPPILAPQVLRLAEVMERLAWQSVLPLGDGR